jgi:aldehyde:ferredoxin oxidoreductase
MHGWMGKILHVDLNNSEITQFATQPYAEKYLGGRGIAARIYWETVTPEIGAFDPENRLIFVVGTLVATGVQAATYMSVAGKSPMTIPDGYCYGSIGGFVGAEMKNAGFDGIVITGRASKPVYLWVHDGEAELRDASSLWGQNAYRTGEMLQEFHGDRTRFITTGAAGEHLVRTAIMTASHESTCSAGFGAVMGAKNLKAIALRGTGRDSVVDRDRLKELNRYIVSIGHHMASSAPPLVMGTKYEKLIKAIDKGKCYQCGMECLRRLFRYGDKLEGYRKCQSIEYYMPSKLSHEDEPIETFFKAPALANDYSLDSWELRHIIDWLYDCQQSGALTDEEIGLPLSRIGTGEFLEKLLHAIAYREGFGDILADGLMRARDRVPARARAMFRYNIAPIGVQDIYAPRRFVAHALLYSMEPRIHHNILHEIPITMMSWVMNQSMPGATPVTTQVFRNIARAFWGSEAAAAVSSYEGKALAAKKIQNRTYAKESLGLCDFTWPIIFSENIPGYVGDPDLDAKVFTAVTGIAGEEIDFYAERMANLQRAILLREGRKVPEADFPPDYNFTEPLPTSSEFGVEMVPGPGDEPVRVIGNVLDRDKFTAMLKEYYRLRGWDEDTGLPRAETLAALGIADLRLA